MIYLIIYLGIGFILSPLVYANTLYFWQKKYPSLADRRFYSDRALAIQLAIFIVITPPIGFLVAYLNRDAFGFMWKWNK